MGLRVEDSTCSCCEDKHVTVWAVITDRYRRLCVTCYEHAFGEPPEDVLAPEVPG